MSRADREAVAFLQWALPRLGLRWTGFRKVRRQVARRLAKRCAEIGLSSLDAYRAHLAVHPDEWRELDSFCRITISRFHRDRGVFAALHERVLPALTETARTRGSATLRAWSVGCASGEEPYTLRLLWDLDAGSRFSGRALEIVASDADAHLLRRAARAVYPSSSLREVPAIWLSAFSPRLGPDGETLHALAPRFQNGIAWRQEDVRIAQPAGLFDLVLCRNLAFTYFDADAQCAFLRRILERLFSGGALVVGTHETPPADSELKPWPECPCVWKRTGPS